MGVIAQALVLHDILATMSENAAHESNNSYYHTSNSRECMGVNGESLQLHAVYKKPYFYCKSRENPYQYYKSRENPYQVLQVMRAASKRAMKSKVRMIKSLSP